MTQTLVHDILKEAISEIDLSLFYEDSNHNIYSYSEYDEFDRPATGYWYELKFIGDTVRPEALGTSAKNEWKGIAQINMCVEKSIKTITASRDFSKETAKKKQYDEQMRAKLMTGGVQYIFDNAYAAIAEVIKRGVYIKGVRIKKVYNSSAIDHDDFFSMPITIEWWAHLDN